MSATTAGDQIREVLATHARLGTPVSDIEDDGDLYAAGMTSHASVNVMLALEDLFDIEFPDELLRRSTFASIAAIAGAIDTLKDDQ